MSKKFILIINILFLIFLLNFSTFILAKWVKWDKLEILEKLNKKVSYISIGFDDSFWCVTTSGDIFFYDLKANRWLNRTLYRDANKIRVEKIFVSDSNNIYCLDVGGKLCKWDYEKNNWYLMPNLPSDYPKNYFITRGCDGEIMILAASDKDNFGDLLKLEPNGFWQLLPSDKFVQIAILDKNNIWIIKQDWTLGKFVYNPSENTYKWFLRFGFPAKISFVSIGKNKDVLCVADNKVYKFDEKKLNNFKTNITDEFVNPTDCYKCWNELAFEPDSSNIIILQVIIGNNLIFCLDDKNQIYKWQE